VHPGTPVQYVEPGQPPAAAMILRGGGDVAHIRVLDERDAIVEDVLDEHARKDGQPYWRPVPT